MAATYDPENPSGDPDAVQDLRGLKNAVNFFGKSLASGKKANNFSMRSIGSNAQQAQAIVPNSYVQNPTRPDVPVNQVYSPTGSQRSGYR